MPSMAADTQDRLRSAAGTLAAVVAALYLIVGFEVVRVDGIADVEPGPAVPLVIAGVLFAALAALLFVVRRRIVWVLGAALQVLVIVGYVAISSERDPAFEPWGLTIKVLELALLVALSALALRGSRA